MGVRGVVRIAQVAADVLCIVLACRRLRAGAGDHNRPLRHRAAQKPRLAFLRESRRPNPERRQRQHAKEPKVCSPHCSLPTASMPTNQSLALHPDHLAQMLLFAHAGAIERIRSTHFLRAVGRSLGNAIWIWRHALWIGVGCGLVCAQPAPVHQNAPDMAKKRPNRPTSRMDLRIDLHLRPQRTARRAAGRPSPLASIERTRSAAPSRQRPCIADQPVPA